MTDTTARRDVATFCRVCEPACGLVATVDDGAIVDVRADDEHPVSKGFACAKGIAALDIHHDPDRLNHPMRRDGERWVQASWDDAIDGRRRRAATGDRRARPAGGLDLHRQPDRVQHAG